MFDTDPSSVEAAVEEGAIAAASPAEFAARCGVTVLSLPNPAAVERVLLADDGVLAGARPSTIVVDLSTVSPETSRRMFTMAIEKHVHYLDAPGQRGGGQADVRRRAWRTGREPHLHGGEASAFEDSRPVMELLGEVFLHVGPPGSGSTVKVISNLVSGVYALVAAEAFALGAAAGFSPSRLLEVFRETDAKCFFMTDYLLPRYFDDDLDPGFSVRLQLKDHRLAAELGHEFSVPLIFNSTAVQLYELMASQQLDERDVAIPFMVQMARVDLSAPQTASRQER